MLYYILGAIIIVAIAVYIWIYYYVKNDEGEFLYTEEITIMSKRTLRHYYKDFEIWEIFNFLSPEEAQKCIDVAENTAKKGNLETKRPNMIAQVNKENYSTAENIGKSISKLMDTSTEHKSVFGIYKYVPGEEIKSHYDGCVTNKDAACAEVEVSNLIFLNDDYQGGELFFYGLGLKITPEIGKLVLFKNYDKNAKRVDRSGYETNVILNGMQYLLR